MNTTLPLHIWEPLHEPGLQGAFVKLSLAWYFPGAEVADQGVGIDDAGRFSHADELFNYKGQLLPLHLRARLQMVEKLLYEINQQEEAEIMMSSSTILLLLLLVFVLLVFSKLQGRQLLNP